MANQWRTPAHIPDVNLIQFADSEMPMKLVRATETHLRTCKRCRTRMEQLRRGAEAYNQYHSEVLTAALKIPQNWQSLEARLASTEGSRKRVLPPARWWAAAALTCSAMLLGWFWYRDTPARHMQQVLRRAAELPPPEHRRLKVMTSGHSWYRAAMLAGRTPDRGSIPGESERQGTRALFVKANYSWDDPLSARSFAAWRKQLKKKRDRVLSTGAGGERYYRVETATSTGVLRKAALTLRANTLVAVGGAFHFEDEIDVRMEDAGEMPTAPVKREPKRASPVERAAVLKPVSLQEELRVFAALDAIGADAGEQVTVEIDTSKQQIVVTGLGLSRALEQQIREALRDIPAATARFTSGQPKGDANRPADITKTTPDKSSGDKNAPLRARLEAQAGGGRQYQAMMDSALDASSATLAQAHALYTLARKFPPAVAGKFGPPEQEILIRLRRHHATAIKQAIADLTDSLRPLINLPNTKGDETQVQGSASWNVSAAQLYEQAKLLDASLGRMLGGSYSREAGEGILNDMPNKIQKLEALAQAQEQLQ